MPTSASSFAAAVWAILRKECRTEWRTRYGLNASLLFAITTLTSVSFAAGRLGDRADLLGALLWIVLLFASLASLHHGFVREVEGENPVRVVLDPDGRLDPGRNVFSDGAARTLVVRRASEGHTHPTAEGDVLMIPVAGAGGFDPRAVLQALRDEGYRRVLIEGGGITVSRFVQAGVVDRLHVTVAPLLIGSGRSALTLTAIESLDQALRPPCRHFHLGEDVLFDLDLRRGAAAQR